MAKTRRSQRRDKLRQELWPDADDEMWHGPRKERGWSAVPRTLSAVLAALDDRRVRRELDLTRVYVDVWTRSFDEGLVEVPDEVEAAFLCGFSKRRVRSWRERIARLAELGFIRVFKVGIHDVGAIGIVHPNIAMTRLKKQGLVDDALWSEYVKLLDACAGTAPLPPEDVAALFDPPEVRVPSLAIKVEKAS